MGKIYFVSGIDTDAGKTYATGILAGAWISEGRRVITQKMIQTGCGTDTNSVSEDIARHRELMGIGLQDVDLDHTTCPVRLAYPASPDLASRLEGVEIDIEEIDRNTSKLAGMYDTVLLEGAGGLMVPLKGAYTIIDYIRDRSLPLILVTNPRLGSINHTLLSLEVCRVRQIDLRMVIYNRYPVTDQPIVDDTRMVILNYLAEYFPGCEFVELGIQE